MLKLILYKELREITGSLKFTATFAICSLLIILSFFIGIKNYQSGVDEYNASKAAELSKFATVKDWNSLPRHSVYLPQEPLASLVMGISNDIGKTAVLFDTSYQAFRDSTYSEQTVFAVFRFLDLEFVFMIVLSLFAILFTFDAVNGEKERGTLRLSFANPVPRATYILGKIIGSFIALGLPLLVPLLIGMLLLPIMGVELSTEEWMRLGLFILCGLFYLGVFLTLSLFISSITKHSSSSFLFLLTIWVCFVLIIPRASVLLAGNMVEVPSTSKIYYQRLQLQQQNTRDYLKNISKVFTKAYKEVGQSGDTSPEAMKNAQKKASDALDKIRNEQSEKVDEYVYRLYEERYNKQAQQEKLALGISRVSPTAVFTLAATELCGTSLELRNNFREKAAEYTASYSRFLDEKQNQNQTKTKNSKPIDHGEIPDFIYHSNELSAIIQNALPDMGILLFFNLIFFCGAFIAFLRYDLR